MEWRESPSAAGNSSTAMTTNSNASQTWESRSAAGPSAYRPAPSPGPWPPETSSRTHPRAAKHVHHRRPNPSRIHGVQRGFNWDSPQRCIAGYRPSSGLEGNRSSPETLFTGVDPTVVSPGAIWITTAAAWHSYRVRSGRKGSHAPRSAGSRLASLVR